MAKKIELLHTTYDESGNIESQEVVHPLTSPDCVIMENGETLADVMGDGIATPTLTHEGTSFKVGVGDSNIEVVDGDVAGMTLKGQSYQNILPKPTTLIMETDEQEFKINDKIDSNIIIDDNIAEIATVKGKTIVNAVQEESGSEYTVLGEDLSGQSIVTTNKPEGNIKGVTLQGQTLVNAIQEPCEDDYVVLGAEDGIEISAETGGHGTIEDTVQGGLNGAVLEGMTLVNLASNLDTRSVTITEYYVDEKVVDDLSKLQIGKKYTILFNTTEVSGNHVNYNEIEVGMGMTAMSYQYTKNNGDTPSFIQNKNGMSAICFTYGEEHYQATVESNYSALFIRPHRRGSEPIEGESISFTRSGFILVEGDWLDVINELPFNDCFEGMQSIEMPVLTTTGKNLFDVDKLLLGKYQNNDVYNYSIADNSNHSIYYLYVKPNTTYTINMELSGAYYDENNKPISWKDISNSSFTTPDNCKFIVLNINNYKEKDLSQFQIEEGSTATTYEPYQSSTVTTSEEVELRGIGDVKDELDLQTGKLTQRIGEVVLDGSDDENWQYDRLNTDVFVVKMALSNTVGVTGEKGVANILCKDYVSMDVYNVYNDNIEGIGINGRGEINLAIKREKLIGNTTDSVDVSHLKTYLQSNPITVQYELATPTIETIDLQVTDQDGNTIPHIQTQPTVTHITASSDYLIPTVTIDNNLAYDTIIKPSTLYTVRFKHDTVNADNPLTVDLGGTTQEVTSTEFTITTPSELVHNQLIFSGKNNVVSEVQVIEGDVTNIEYPFFEGMNDVKFSDSQFVGRGRNLAKMEKGYIDSVNGLDQDSETAIRSNYIPINPNNKYRIYPLDSNASSFLAFYDKNKTFISRTSGSQRKDMTVIPSTTPSNARYMRFTNYGESIDFSIEYMCEKGDVTSYVPYQPIITVQQDIDSIPLTSDMFEQNGWLTSNILRGMSLQQIATHSATSRVRVKSLIPVKPNKTYEILGSITGWALMFDKNGGLISPTVTKVVDGITTFSTTYETYYLAPVLRHSDDSDISPSNLDSMNLILQEVPQEIVLRGIGDVKDELDLTRGEYIQRIGEIVLDGSEDEQWTTYAHSINKNTNPKVYTYAIHALGMNVTWGNTDLNIKCDKLKTRNEFGDGIETIYWAYRPNCIASVNGNIGISTYCKTIDELKQELSKNPITVHYRLSTSIIHKVNLTNTKVIPSYATETHYETITPSDSLIPNITIPSTLNYNVAIKPSTEYTIRANTSDNLTVDLGGTTGTLSNGKVTLTTPDTLTHNEVKFSGTGKVKELMVVEGNEIKDNVPFFNGMKDVQMGGIKLVNIARGAVVTGTDVVSENTNKTQFTYNGTVSDFRVIKFDNSLLKPNTTYTMYLNITENTSVLENPIKFLYSGDNYFVDLGGTGIKKVAVTTPNKIGRVEMAFRPTTTSQKIVVQNPMIIEGDWTYLDEIPFIESEMIIEQPIIRSQGKNLLDLESKPFTVASEGTTFTKSGNTYTITTLANSTQYDYIRRVWTVDNDKWLRDVAGKELTLSISSMSCTNSKSMACIQLRIECMDGTKTYPSIFIGNTTKTFIMPVNVKNLQMQIMTNNTSAVLTEDAVLTISGIQLELGSTATSYEPFKHQTLYSNRVIGYEEGVYYGYGDGVKYTSANYNSVMADVEGLSIAYVTNGSSNFTFWDKDGVFISGKGQLDTALSLTDRNGFITVPTNAKYMKFASSCVTDSNTDYTKATVTGDLPLRSLPNSVCDTLNLVTGEYVQRVGELVLDGSEDESLIYYGKDNLKNVAGICIVLPNNCDKLTSNSIISNSFPSKAGSSVVNVDEEGVCGRKDLDAIYIKINKMKLKTYDVAGWREYLSQNPITVQYELATPIVRKLGFTTKGNYREQVLDGSETWAMDAIDNTKTIRMTKKTVSPLQNPLYDTVLFTDDYHVRAGDENHSTYEYITCIGNGIYINIYQSKVSELSVQGCTQWLSHNPIKVGYITSAQSSESYSNIHKPIFFNDVDVQYLPNNVDIQPELTYQVGTRNSYVMDMMKANTKYSIKMLSGDGVVLIDSTRYSLVNNRTFVSPSTLTNKELIISGLWYEPMIIEGDVTGKNLPYFKGILSSYHDVDEIEVYSYNNENHNTTLIEMPTRLETVKVVRPVIENGSLNQTTGANYDDGDALVKNVRTKDYLPVQPGEIIKFYNYGQGRAVNMNYYDINKQFIKYEFYDGVSTRPTVPKDCYFVRMYCGKSACSDITLTRQAWKPIQLNSLPNGVYDEIIMKPNSNKAQLVQRVGKVVLDGSISYEKYLIDTLSSPQGTLLYSAVIKDLKNAIDENIHQALNNTLNYELCFHHTDNEAFFISSTNNRVFIRLHSSKVQNSTINSYMQDHPQILYYELATPIIHEIQLKGYPHVYEDGTVTLNTDTPHQTLVSYNVNQEQLINTQNETIIRHDQQIDDLYYYIEMYLEEIYQMELFRMKLELSL